MLHITNGDSAAGSLRQTGLPGRVGVWAEVLHEGPVPLNVTPAEWRHVRAEFYAGLGWGSVEENEATLLDWDRQLHSAGPDEPIVFWFEHDLYDQLILINLLEAFGRRGYGGSDLNLICIDRFPGATRFVGLGQLTPTELLSLFDSRRPIEPEQLQLAQRAWTAFRGGDPTAIEALLATDTSALPFLRAALLRHLEQFPSVRNGLNRTENAAISILEYKGPMSLGALFCAVNDAEEAPFMGDTTFAHHIGPLWKSDRPLIQLEQDGSSDLLFSRRASITERGRSLLAGHEDWVRISGIERWLGGVHLDGKHADWRWDGTSKSLVFQPRSTSA